MIVKLSTLLSFSLLPKVKEKGGKKKAGKKKGGKSSGSKKSGKSSAKSGKSSKKGGRKGKGKEKKVKVEKPKPEKPKYVLDVGAPIGFAHIEYDLFPSRSKYQIDVVCWNEVAKIFSADGNKAIKTTTLDDKAWVFVYLEHYLNEFPIDDLLNLHKHVIKFTIFTKKSKLGASAKSEKSKVFYMKEDEVDSVENFIEVFNENPNIDNIGIALSNTSEENHFNKATHSRIIINDKEIVTVFGNIPDFVHKFKVDDVLKRTSENITVECKDFVAVCLPPPIEIEEDTEESKEKKNKKKKDKKGKGSKKSDKSSKKSTKKGSKKSSKKSSKSKKSKKEKANDTLTMMVPGEIFYTDPNFSIYDLKNGNNTVTNAYLLLTISKLMTVTQKCRLNPLIIKIKKISNLPVKILEHHRFTSIFIRYYIPYIAQCMSIQKPLTSTIKLNEAHAHFTDTIPPIKFSEFMQTRRLNMEIYGIRDPIRHKVTPSLYGTENSDAKISKYLPPTRNCVKQGNNEESVVAKLAVASYNLSSLLKPTWDFLSDESCHDPYNLLNQTVHTIDAKLNFVDVLTTSEVNKEPFCNLANANIISESQLTDSGTRLKIEVYLSAPYLGLLRIQASAEFYNRLFIIAFNSDLANLILNELLIFNQNILGPEVIMTNFLRSTKYRSADPGEVSEVLTGFVIDNGSSFAFYVEGLARGYILTLWNQFKDCNRSDMRLFFNTDFAFEKRLYAEFIPYGGLYIITLSIPLQEILAKEKLYLTGNAPIPCYKALQKLNLMFASQTLRSMVQFCLFPTARELLSIGTEYSVTLRWIPD